MSPLGRLVNLSVLRKTSNLHKLLPNIRAITTSNKKDDTTVVGPTPTTTQEDTSLPGKKKYFYDYGFHGETEEEETNNMNASFFMYVTMGLVCTSFYFMYAPSTNMHDWAQREGYLELRRREKLGLPLVDPNYVDPSTIYLPTEEELGDTDIII